MFNLVNFRFNTLYRYRAFFEGPQEPGTQFFLVERLPAAILFNDPRQDQFSHLVSSKALSTTEAFSPATHLSALGD